MSEELIVVRQLPVIEEKLKLVKADITERTRKALKMVCTEETLTAVKKERAALNHELADWEEKRKAVKSAVMSPYEQFEAVYKDCIQGVFRAADLQLKAKIDDVENGLKEQKEEAVKAYFTEYRDSCGHGLETFLAYEQAQLHVTRSASLRSLKEQAKAFIDRICEDLTLIDSQEHREEILVEYKKSLNASAAITGVCERYRAIEEEKARAEERRLQQEAEQAAAERVAEALNEETTAPLAPPVVCEADELLTVTFTVHVPRSRAKAMKDYITNYFIKEGFKYE